MRWKQKVCVLFATVIFLWLLPRFTRIYNCIHNISQDLVIHTYIYIYDDNNNDEHDERDDDDDVDDDDDNDDLLVVMRDKE